MLQKYKINTEEQIWAQILAGCILIYTYTDILQLTTSIIHIRKNRIIAV